MANGKFLSLLVVLLCLLGASRIQYKEDITDFLPVDESYRTSVQLYQEMSGADHIALQFTSASVCPDSLIAAVDAYGEILQRKDTGRWVADDWRPEIDPSQIQDVIAYLYCHLPYLLDTEAYARADSLWGEDFFRQRASWVRSELASMSSSVMQPILEYDPLGLGSVLMSHLQDFRPDAQLIQCDGHLFTSDSLTCIVHLRSPFGGSETQHNALLAALLQECADSLQLKSEGTCVSTFSAIGSPVIAVGNARQIRRDTIWAVSISVLLILALLWWAFGSFRALVHIALATGFGFLFALGGLSLFHTEISLIVVGVASVLVGIAVNYPLHLVCHRQEHPGQTPRQLLRELIRPLVIGNVTTIGAFLTLVPLDAIALRDLGIFSSLMLLGTILFVIFVQPYLRQPAKVRLDAVSEVSSASRSAWQHRVVSSPWTLVILLSLTLILGWRSLDTAFDSDLSHLNFMSEEQREGMVRLSSLRTSSSTVIYLSGTSSQLEAARPRVEQLQQEGLLLSVKDPSRFLPSPERQREHLQLWREFWQHHPVQEFLSVAVEEGFSPEAFAPMVGLITSVGTDSIDNRILAGEDFLPLTTTVLSGVSCMELEAPSPEVARQIEEELGGFDMNNLNRSISSSLTVNFNYIGFACACIVFVFLLVAFRRLELALVAFLPMVVGWLWILGLMQLCGIQFNLVNIILATFIFGQGDDYTIFVTEGLVSQYRQQKREGSDPWFSFVSPFSRSIILSALIMLAGIGSLIVAQHPAMHSLATVTIVGMAVVVLMAQILPPVLFRWLLHLSPGFRRYMEKE